MLPNLGKKFWLLVILGLLTIIFGLLWSIQQILLLPIGFFNVQNRYLLDGVTLFLTILWVLIYLSPTLKFEKHLFPLFHFVFPLGVFPVLFSLKALGVWSTIDEFTMGSYALVVTGFFLAIPKAADKLDRYFILLYTLSATLAFFMAGLSTGIHSIVTGAQSYGIFVGSVADSLFLLGIADLMIILILCFRFVIKVQNERK